MKLKPISVVPERKYAREFFESVAEKPADAFFEYEEPTNYTALRTIARSFEKTLGRKFAIRTVKESDATGKEVEKFAVGVTTRIITPKKRTPKSTVAAPPSFDPIHTPAQTEE